MLFCRMYTVIRSVSRRNPYYNHTYVENNLKARDVNDSISAFLLVYES